MAKWNNRPPKEGMVKYGWGWLTEEEAKLYIHPTKFDNKYKEICRMYKKRGPYVYIFQIDPMDAVDGDDWFIMCSKVKRTNGVVNTSSTLIRKDVGTWIRGIMSMDKYTEPIWSEHYQNKEERLKLFNLL
jgi:hypothetical protein